MVWLQIAISHVMGGKGNFSSETHWDKGLLLKL